RFAYRVPGLCLASSSATRSAQPRQSLGRRRSLSPTPSVNESPMATNRTGSVVFIAVPSARSRFAVDVLVASVVAQPLFVKLAVFQESPQAALFGDFDGFRPPGLQGVAEGHAP